MYTYPDSELALPDPLLATAGSFWARTYGGGDLVAAVLHARNRLDAQARQDLDELLAAASRLTVPPLHTDLWYPLVLRESERNGRAALAKYDGAYVHDGGLAYDVPASAPGFAFPVPETLRHAPLLLNRLSAPSLALVRGADYTLTPGVLRLRSDPFADPLVPVREVWDGGAVVDREAVLWAFRAGFDRGAIYRQFGYAVGARGEGAPAYRDAVNALFDAVVLGASEDALSRLFSAALGVPLAEGDETVEAVFRDRRGLCVVTDARAYRFAPGANPAVSAGDRVSPGDPLCDALRFHSFGRGRVPDGLRAFACGPGVLAEGYYGEVVFENRVVPLEVSYPGGKARVSFRLGGHPPDVARFWDQVHAAGLARGVTLANLLDVRPAPVGEPTPQSLPAAVNPLEFLCRNVLRANAALVRVRPSGLPPGAPGWPALRALRQVVPPHTLLVVLAEYEHADDPVTMDGPGGPTRPGCVEAAALAPCTAASETVAAGTYVAEAVTLSVVASPCT